MSNYEYMFFNCDEWKSYASMNPGYNDTVYRKREGRRALWRHIKAQVEDGSIEIDEAMMPIVRNHILNGNPCDASDYITYGTILALRVA